MPVGTPLVLSIESLNKFLWKDFFQIAEQYNVIFPMEIDPATIAFLRMPALSGYAFCRVENLVKRFFLDITQNNIKILANRHIAIGMDYERIGN